MHAGFSRERYYSMMTCILVPIGTHCIVQEHTWVVTVCPRRRIYLDHSWSSHHSGFFGSAQLGYEHFPCALLRTSCREYCTLRTGSYSTQDCRSPFSGQFSWIPRFVARLAGIDPVEPSGARGGKNVETKEELLTGRRGGVFIAFYSLRPIVVGFPRPTLLNFGSCRHGRGLVLL